METLIQEVGNTRKPMSGTNATQMAALDLRDQILFRMNQKHFFILRKNFPGQFLKNFQDDFFIVFYTCFLLLMRFYNDLRNLSTIFCDLFQ